MHRASREYMVNYLIKSAPLKLQDLMPMEAH
jgi:hypothetical protein